MKYLPYGDLVYAHKCLILEKSTAERGKREQTGQRLDLSVDSQVKMLNVRPAKSIL